jgi:hypothetical protein
MASITFTGKIQRINRLIIIEFIYDGKLNFCIIDNGVHITLIHGSGINYAASGK